MTLQSRATKAGDQTAPVLSNFESDLAERAGEAFRLGHAKTIEAAEHYLQCGAILSEAKAEIGHGRWLPFLDRAGIPERTARRMMRLFRSGLTAEQLADQGIKAALAALAKIKPKSVTVSDLQDSRPQTRAGIVRLTGSEQEKP